MFGWIFRKHVVKVDAGREQERERLGLTLIREGILARQLSTEVQRTLAKGALSRLRNGS